MNGKIVGVIETPPESTPLYQMKASMTLLYENNNPTPPKTYKRVDKIAKF